MLTLQGMAGTGIPGTAGLKGEEGEQVGRQFGVRFAAKDPLEAAVSPESPPIPRI